MTRADIRSSLDNRMALLCTLVGETLGEPIEGAIGVASVIRTRAIDARWPDTIKDVCLQYVIRQGREIGQFSCWFENNANSQRVYALAEAMLTGKGLGFSTEFLGSVEKDSGAAIIELAWVADGIIAGALRDNTRGSNHYLTRWLFDKQTVDWAKNRQPRVELGRHVFLKL